MRILLIQTILNCEICLFSRNFSTNRWNSLIRVKSFHFVTLQHKTGNTLEATASRGVLLLVLKKFFRFWEARHVWSILHMRRGFPRACLTLIYRQLTAQIVATSEACDSVCCAVYTSRREAATPCLGLSLPQVYSWLNPAHGMANHIYHVVIGSFTHRDRPQSGHSRAADNREDGNITRTAIKNPFNIESDRYGSKFL